MLKGFLTVGATLLAGAFMVLPQAPDGAAPAGKAPTGPDVASAVLVYSVCASCHTLDRVKNKTGDRDAWTATVNKMKEKGAAMPHSIQCICSLNFVSHFWGSLHDEQVPTLVEYLVKNAGGLTVAGGGGGGGKGKGGGKGGGFAGKNLKVLTSAAVPVAMQNFVEALGLLDKGVCSFCHVDDRSSDEKMEKVIARNMIAMVNEINARFPDGKQHVTCYTCHRGSTTPLTAAP
jgi:hypothetical protein